MAAVVVPWAGDDPDRLAARTWVLDRLHGLFSAVSLGLGGEPWCKATAVANGLSSTSAGVVVVHDADVWCDGLAEAVAAVEAGAPWAVPHGQVHRLTQEATHEVLAGTEPSTGMDTTERPYQGHAGGGIVVVRADVYRECPIDPRFVGWGQEDDAWAAALTVLYGKPWRRPHPLWHLWHPPQPRHSRIIGSTASQALWRRYQAARRRPAHMRALLEEVA